MATKSSSPLIRPRPVSVIAVVWLYLGGSWVFTGVVMAALWTWLLAFLPGRAGPWPPSAMAFMYGWVSTIIALGAAGIWAALGLLELRGSARARLEKLNFITAGLLAVFGFYWAHDMLSTQYLSDLHFELALGSVLMGCISSVPFLWMAKALRGRDVRTACEAAHR